MKSARVGGDVSARDKFFAAEPSEKSEKSRDLKGKGQKGKGREVELDDEDARPKEEEKDDESDYMSDSSDDGSDGEAAAFARAMRRRIKEKPGATDGGKPERNGKASKGREERRERKPYERPEGKKPSGPPRVRALSRSPPPAALPARAAAAEFREKKREAFAKKHVGRAKGQPNMAARMGVLLEKIKRDTS